MISQALSSAYSAIGSLGGLPGFALPKPGVGAGFVVGNLIAAARSRLGDGGGTARAEELLTLCGEAQPGECGVRVRTATGGDDDDNEKGEL